MFKNQITLGELKYKISYKEALTMRDVRLKRLEKEYKSSQGALKNDDLEEMLGR